VNGGQTSSCRLHIADFPRYFYDFGALKPEDAGGPMVAKVGYRGVPLVLAAAVGLLTAASAQQATQPAASETPAKQAKPKASGSKAPKSESKSEPKSEQKAATKKDGAPGAGGGSAPTLLGQFGSWGAYTANSGGRQLCYAISEPSSKATQPPGRPRDPVYIFISTRPTENVRNEVSVIIGYPFKPGFEATVDIGSAKYAMFTQNDGAWVKNPAEEARMVDTMRRGADLIVSGESGKGTKSTDRYALRGLGQALDRIAQECK
jgi:invasion protein IalB